MPAISIQPDEKQQQYVERARRDLQLVVSAVDLGAKAKAYVDRHFVAVSTHTDWLGLSAKAVEDVLSRDADIKSSVPVRIGSGAVPSSRR